VSEGVDIATTAAGYLSDGEVVLVGVGAPGRAATLAQREHAPKLTLVYESGAIGSRPAEPPLSIGDPTLFAGALSAMSVADVFSFVIEGGMIDTAFVGAAEIDRQGRLNSTVVGAYDSPKVRLPGSGGACEIVEYARRVLVLSPLQPRRFPAEVGFVTSAPRPGVEVIVVTDRCVLRRDPAGDELVLERLLGDTTVAEVRENVGWDLELSDKLAQEAGSDV
jgi:glutaconate CoA-transferase subunit B